MYIILLFVYIIIDLKKSNEYTVIYICIYKIILVNKTKFNCKYATYFLYISLHFDQFPTIIDITFSDPLTLVAVDIVKSTNQGSQSTAIFNYQKQICG